VITVRPGSHCRGQNDQRKSLLLFTSRGYTLRVSTVRSLPLREETICSVRQVSGRPMACPPGCGGEGIAAEKIKRF